jgi:hypothetical protein
MLIKPTPVLSLLSLLHAKNVWENAKPEVVEERRTEYFVLTQNPLVSPRENVCCVCLSKRYVRVTEHHVCLCHEIKKKLLRQWNCDEIRMYHLHYDVHLN